MRRPLSRLAKVRLFDRHRGICHVCGLRIHAERGEQWEAEHKTPIWLGGADDEFNMAPVHLDPCHRDKTAGEAGDRAKSNSQRQAFLGIPKPVKKRMAAGRKSGLRKTLRNGVIPRLSQSEQHRALMAKRYGEFQ